MELIVINENKLKIIMNAYEMKQYGLDENEFHLSISNTRKILTKILHNSPIKTGFEDSSPNERILLQLYPEKKGGCELYVTRLALENEFNIGDEDPMKKKENSLLPVASNTANKEKGFFVCYRFEELNDIISSCKALQNCSCTKESSIYLGEDNKYHLLLMHTDKGGAGCRCSAILSEFGELLNADYANLDLCERGKIICKNNGIEIFSKL